MFSIYDFIVFLFVYFVFVLCSGAYSRIKHRYFLSRINYSLLFVRNLFKNHSWGELVGDFFEFFEIKELDKDSKSITFKRRVIEVPNNQDPHKAFDVPSKRHNCIWISTPTSDAGYWVDKNSKDSIKNIFQGKSNSGSDLSYEIKFGNDWGWGWDSDTNSNQSEYETFTDITTNVKLSPLPFAIPKEDNVDISLEMSEEIEVPAEGFHEVSYVLYRDLEDNEFKGDVKKFANSLVSEIDDRFKSYLKSCMSGDFFSYARQHISFDNYSTFDNTKPAYSMIVNNIDHLIDMGYSQDDIVVYLDRNFPGLSIDEGGKGSFKSNNKHLEYKVDVKVRDSESFDRGDRLSIVTTKDNLMLCINSSDRDIILEEDNDSLLFEYNVECKFIVKNEEVLYMINCSV